MREITIDFENCSYSQVAGYVGECNATEIKVIKPVELSGSKFLVAFMLNGEIFRSKFFAADEEIKVKLWKQLTLDTALYVQLESYDESEDYLGKSAVAKLVFQKSLDGTDSVADTENADLIADIAANTTMREKLSDKADILVRFSVSDSGELLFNGNQIGSGNGNNGFSPIVNITEIEGGHRVTITDAEGTESFDVIDGVDGKDGQNGKDGADGYTPIKGVDYFTEADKTEFVELVLEALPVAEGAGF